MNPIQPLQKFAQNKRTGGTKYYIDCSFFSYNSKAIRESIKTNKLIRNTEEVSILQAVATDKLINKKHKRIIVKIDKKMKNVINNKYHSFAEKEFTIGEALNLHSGLGCPRATQQEWGPPCSVHNESGFAHMRESSFSMPRIEVKGIPGFIKFICVFPCYDDTYDNNDNDTITREDNVIEYNKSICQSEPNDENKKEVLIMPFIQDGSVANYHWTQENIGLVKNLLIQSVLSLGMAYDKIKFTHEDLHTGNLLFKPTKQRKITYSFSGIETPIEISLDHNKKLVIMDFGKSKTIIDTPDNSIRNFWNNIYYLCKHIDDSMSYEDYYITFELQEAIDFIRNATLNNANCSAVIQLADIIDKSTCRIIRKTFMKYTPLP